MYAIRSYYDELDDRNMIVSRRRIGRITKQEGLVSSYTTAHFHSQKDTCNESKVTIIVNRKFDQPYRNVIVSDFTYVITSYSIHYTKLYETNNGITLFDIEKIYLKIIGIA